MHARSLRFLVATSALALSLAAAKAQTPVPRAAPAAGSIVAAKGGEELRFVREGDWRSASLKQDLLGGDTLRTNAIGNLAILFSDQTQIRVGRNSVLTVNEVSSGSSNTQLNLQAGNVWARASRGGSGVDVKTPAAVAAIRGTDWSLSVDASGRTSLIVLEGVVELSNAQGSVTVRQGEGAVAAIGQAPTKFVLVSPNDREQMLFYLSVRDVFTHLPATTIDRSALIGTRARIEATPPDARSTEDWLVLSEVLLMLDGRAVASRALNEARSRPLSASQRARADLVAGLVAGAERRWKDAIVLFDRAKGGLDPRRRAWAEYGRYAAASLADPKRVQPEPRIGTNDPRTLEIRAFLTGFRKDLNAAAIEVREAEKRFPNDVGLALFSAELALLLNRREDMRAAYERAKAIDPNDPAVLHMGATIKADFDRNLDAAIVDLHKAASVVSGVSLWNDIGLIQQDRNAPVEAEAAFRRAIEIEPENPISYANLAILLLDQSRVEEAGALIDKALSLDPTTAYTQRGRYLLQKGLMREAIESMLAGSAVNPAHSNTLLTLADAYFQNGDYELAQQTLDNADRLDPHAAITAIVRTIFAIDQYQADEAILSAREALRRARARGGDYAGIAVNRQSGSYPVEAYNFIGLNDWARFYADRTFDPFQATSFLDQAIVNRPSVFTTKPALSNVGAAAIAPSFFTLQVQGLLLDPLAVSGRIGRHDPLRRPFLDAEIGGGLVSRGGELGWQADATVQGFSNWPVPTSFSLGASRTLAAGPLVTDQETASSAALSVGVAPSGADRFVLIGTASQAEPGLAAITDLSFGSDSEKDVNLQGVAGWSHTFGYQNVLNAAVFGASSDSKQLQQRSQFDWWYEETNRLRRKTRIEGAVAALNHTLGLSGLGLGDLTLRYGAEVQGGNFSRKAVLDYFFVNNLGYTESNREFENTKASFQGGRVYADLFWRPTDWFEAQAGLHQTFQEFGDQPSEDHLGPRIGVGVSPFEGQWLRAAYTEQTDNLLSYTLSPVTTVGLLPNVLPVGTFGQTDTLALRWDAEWSPRFFTSVEYQRQNVGGLTVSTIDTLDSFDVGKGRIDWFAATANLWLGYGIGIFGTVGGTDSEILSGEGFGSAIPYVPEQFARAGVTFVHPSRIRFTLTQNFIGERAGDLADGRLDSFWTTDAALTWETPDRRLFTGLTVLNLFDEEYDLAFGIPGPRRTVAVSMKARF